MLTMSVCFDEILPPTLSSLEVACLDGGFMLLLLLLVGFVLIYPKNYKQPMELNSHCGELSIDGGVYIVKLFGLVLVLFFRCTMSFHHRCILCVVLRFFPQRSLLSIPFSLSLSLRLSVVLFLSVPRVLLFYFVSRCV